MVALLKLQCADVFKGHVRLIDPVRFFSSPPLLLLIPLPLPPPLLPPSPRPSPPPRSPPEEFWLGAPGDHEEAAGKTGDQHKRFRGGVF